jgi:hypothetical protein
VTSAVKIFAPIALVKKMTQSAKIAVMRKKWLKTKNRKVAAAAALVVMLTTMKIKNKIHDKNKEPLERVVF